MTIETNEYVVDVEGSTRAGMFFSEGLLRRLVIVRLTIAAYFVGCAGLSYFLNVRELGYFMFGAAFVFLLQAASGSQDTRRTLRKQAAQIESGGWRIPSRMKADERGLTTSDSSGANGFIPWSRVSRFGVLKDGFVIVHAEISLLWFPISAFPTRYEADQFRQMCEQNVGKPPKALNAPDPDSLESRDLKET